ncbi:MAG: hypothetical protein AB8I08_01000 [Sandaracinaceae bacterium]
MTFARICTVVVALSVLWVVLLPTRAAACSCVQVSAELALREHGAVFEGRVRSVEAVPSGFRVTLEVVQQWKGIESEEAVVFTASNSAACGVAFEPETSWLIYADRHPDGWQTGLCSRTRRIEDAEADLVALGAGVVPVEIGPDDEVEPPRSPPATQAGCASCTVSSPRGHGGLLWLVPLLFVWRRWRRRHRG